MKDTGRSHLPAYLEPPNPRTWLEPKITRDLEGFQWRCMADPQGNEFDIVVLLPQ